MAGQKILFSGRDSIKACILAAADVPAIPELGKITLNNGSTNIP
jgi:hypothetical protein